MPSQRSIQTAVTDAQNRLDTIIAAGHTQFITIRADTVRVLIEAARGKQ